MSNRPHIDLRIGNMNEYRDLVDELEACLNSHEMDQRTFDDLMAIKDKFVEWKPDFTATLHLDHTGGY